MSVVMVDPLHDVLTAMFIELAEDNESRLARAQAETARLRRALQSIVDYNPPWFEESAEDREAAERCIACQGAQKSGWPPSGRCNTHFHSLAAVQDRRQQARNNSGSAMRCIAREALVTASRMVCHLCGQSDNWRGPVRSGEDLAPGCWLPGVAFHADCERGTRAGGLD